MVSSYVFGFTEKKKKVKKKLIKVRFARTINVGQSSARLMTRSAVKPARDVDRRAVELLITARRLRYGDVRFYSC